MKKRFTFIHRLLSVVCCLLAILGCEKTDYTYSNLPAKFIFENAYQAPALYTKQFVFKGSAKEPSYVNLTAITGYSGFNLGLSGLIVGLPNIPEIGKTESLVVCFDLACSNCYNDYNITKPLVIQNGTATCNSCKRTYDLNNVGFISNGEAGKPLYRYRVSYVSNTLVVSNR